MKPKRFEKKLMLKKNTVTDLNNLELNHVRGGGWTYGSCAYTCPVCNTVQTCRFCPKIQTEYETCYTGWCC